MDLILFHDLLRSSISHRSVGCPTPVKCGLYIVRK